MSPRGAYTAFGYKAADFARTNRVTPAHGGSADFHTRYDRELLVRESQRFDRDNLLYQGLINRCSDNILGDGFGLQARTSDPELNRKIEALWCARDDAGNTVGGFCRDPEVRGLFTWWQLERHVLRALLVDGDLGAIKITEGAHAGKLQAIEAERIASLKQKAAGADGGKWIEQGVELDEVGRPVAYHVADYTRWGSVKKTNPRRVLAKDFLFIAHAQRISQTRGVPVMVSNFPMFHRIEDTLNAEAGAWQLLSRFALMITRAEAQRFARDESTASQTATEAGQVPERTQEFEHGIIFHGEEGEKIESIDRNVPGANFEQTVTVFLRMLGLPLGLPLELILLDWSKTNYSSARAALEQAYRMFRTWQKLLIEKWHRPVYEWQVQRWAAESKIPSAPDMLKHEWITPEFPWLDQLKESLAWGNRLDRGLCTHGQALKSVNKDRGEWLDARKAEIQQAIDAAKTLNAQNPEANVDWKIFAGFDPAGAEKLSALLASEAPRDPESSAPPAGEPRTVNRIKPLLTKGNGAHV